MSRGPLTRFSSSRSLTFRFFDIRCLFRSSCSSDPRFQNAAYACEIESMLGGKFADPPRSAQSHRPPSQALSQPQPVHPQSIPPGSVSSSSTYTSHEELPRDQQLTSLDAVHALSVSCPAIRRKGPGGADPDWFPPKRSPYWRIPRCRIRHYSNSRIVILFGISDWTGYAPVMVNPLSTRA